MLVKLNYIASCFGTFTIVFANGNFDFVIIIKKGSKSATAHQARTKAVMQVDQNFIALNYYDLCSVDGND